MFWKLSDDEKKKKNSPKSKGQNTSLFINIILHKKGLKRLLALHSCVLFNFRLGDSQ